MVYLYCLLSAAEKRQIYDRYGKEGLREGAGKWMHVVTHSPASRLLVVWVLPVHGTGD